MGDRGNIFVTQHPHNRPEEGIYVYSHWGGSNLPATLQDALKRGKSRWSDEPYLTRIIIDEVSKTGDDTTGVGVTTYLTDNSYPILRVDSGTMTVGVLGTTRSVSFEKFCELSEDELETFRGDR